MNRELSWRGLRKHFYHESVIIVRFAQKWKFIMIQIYIICGAGCSFLISQEIHWTLTLPGNDLLTRSANIMVTRQDITQILRSLVLLHMWDMGYYVKTKTKIRVQMRKKSSTIPTEMHSSFVKLFRLVLWTGNKLVRTYETTNEEPMALIFWLPCFVLNNAT